VRPHQIERGVAVDAVHGHEDSFGLLDDRAPGKRVLKAVILAVPLERDLDRRLQIVRVPSQDVAESAGARRIADVSGIRRVEQNEDGTRALVRDRRDQRERLLVRGMPADEGDVRLLCALVPVDRLVPEIAQKSEEHLDLHGVFVRDCDPAAVHAIRMMTAVSHVESMAALTYPGEGFIVPRSDQLVLAFFETEGAADGAAGALRGWAARNRRVQVEAVGVLVNDEKGHVKTHKLGPSDGRMGIGIGIALGVVAAIASGGITLVEGAVVGGAGGGIVGALIHRGIGLSQDDAARIGSRLGAGQAAVGVLVPRSQAAAISDELEALGGESEVHEVTAAELAAEI
jgi:uncharacterized membrane protein